MECEYPTSLYLQPLTERRPKRFLQATLQVEALRGCVNISGARSKLQFHPVKLKDMYIETMKRINMQSKEEAELANRILVWVIYANEKLGLNELQHALAISLEPENFDATRIVSEDTLISVCCGLIIVERLRHFGTVVKSIVRLIRESKLRCSFRPSVR